MFDKIQLNTSLKEIPVNKQLFKVTNEKLLKCKNFI